MKCKLLTLILLSVYLASSLISVASAVAPPVIFPSGKTIVIPPNKTVYFGIVKVSTTTTAMHITAFYENFWFNYTVDSAGTQTIYNETVPDNVIIDGVQRPITNGWDYAANTITVFGALTQCFIEWTVTIPSTPTPYTPSTPQTSNAQSVLFKTVVGKTPAPSAEITVYEAAENVFQGRYITDKNGEKQASITPGNYTWEAKYRGTRLTGYFFHVEAETVKIDFGTGQTAVTPLDRTQLLKIGIAAVVVLGGVFAIVTVTKNKRFGK